eukprot:gene4429-5247_t
MMTDPFNEAAASRKELIAEDDAEGRIDAWLTAALGQEFSRNRVKALIEQGAVQLNGNPLDSPNRKIKPGDTVVIDLPEPEDP